MRQYLHWKSYLVIFALTIVGLALYYFNRVAKDMATEEHKKVTMMVEAIKTVAMANPADQTDITFATKMISENNTIPLFITDDHFKIQDSKNIDTSRLAKDPDYIKRKFDQFRALHAPIPYDYSTPGMPGKGYLVYGDS